MPHKILKSDSFEIIFILLTFLQTDVFISNLKKKPLVFDESGSLFWRCKTALSKRKQWGVKLLLLSSLWLYVGLDYILVLIKERFYKIWQFENKLYASPE